MSIDIVNHKRLYPLYPDHNPGSMKKFYLSISVMFFLTTFSYSQSSYSTLKDPELLEKFRSISEEIVCECGCGHPLQYCSHKECVAWGMRSVIENLLVEGKTEEFIVDGFINGFGDLALTDPAFEKVRNEYGDLMPMMASGFGEEHRSHPGAGKNPEYMIITGAVLIFGFALIFIRKRMRAIGKSDAKKDQVNAGAGSSDPEKEKLFSHLYDDEDSSEQ